MSANNNSQDAENTAVPESNTNTTVPQQSSQGQPQPNLNDVVMDLKTMSSLCKQKIMDYSDLTAIFKQMAQISDNLAIVVSTYLADKGELDTSKFKLDRQVN